MGSSLSQRHSVGPDPASRWCPDPGVGAARTFLPGNHPESPSFADQSLCSSRSYGRRSWRSVSDSVCSAAYFAVGGRGRSVAARLPRAGMPYRLMRASHPSGRLTATSVAVILASISIPQWTLQSTRRHRDSNPRHGRDRAVCSTGLHHGGLIALEGFEPSSRTPRARMIGQTTPQGWMRLDISVLSMNVNSLDHELPESVRI